MNKTDLTLSRMRDLGVFLIGISALIATTYLLYEGYNSPQREMVRKMNDVFIKNMEDAQKPK
jgi:hypothetical protein